MQCYFTLDYYSISVPEKTYLKKMEKHCFFYLYLCSTIFVLLYYYTHTHILLNIIYILYYIYIIYIHT